MKIKNFIFFVFICTILSGLIVIVFISAHNYKEISMQLSQNQIHIPNSYKAASTSKGTILLLLAVGVIGVLGISRKKKNIGRPAQRSEASICPEPENLIKDKKKL